MKARVLALFTHSFNILLLCVRVTMCRALFWQLSHHQTLQAPVELKGTCGWSKSPCFHALKGSQISLKVTLIPKGAGEEGGWILFPGSTWLCLQMRVEVPLCFRIIWAFVSHSFLCYYSFRSQPEQNFFFSSQKHLIPADWWVLSWCLIPTKSYFSFKGRLILHS